MLTSVNNFCQVRQELHVFGFRPNLSRRPDESRWYIHDESNGKKRPYQVVESVVNDVVINRLQLLKTGQIYEMGLFSYPFLNLAYNTSKQLAEYLLAASAYRKDTTRLMLETLKIFHNNVGNWGATDIFNVCLMVNRLYTIFFPVSNISNQLLALCPSLFRFSPSSRLFPTKSSMSV